MKYAKVINGVVEVISIQDPQSEDFILVDNAVFVGFTLNNDGTFTAPTPEPEPAATTKPINRVQFKSMLALLGKTVADVETAIDAVITNPTQNTIAKIKVTDSTNYARDNALFSLLGPSLNLTNAQIDTAWAQALEI